MNPYAELIKTIVTETWEQEKILTQLEAVSKNAENYEDEFFRMPTEGSDLLWLAAVDGLMENGYAFEIDWKEDYSTAKMQTEGLLVKMAIPFKIENDAELYDLDAEEFFPKLGAILQKSGLSLINMDIDSDSYVTTVIRADEQDYLLSLDARLKKY